MSNGYDSAREAFLQGPQVVANRVKSIWSGFVGAQASQLPPLSRPVLTQHIYSLDFAARDNVLEVAVGLMCVFSACYTPVDPLKRPPPPVLFSRIASAFTAVVKSLMSDVLLPPISLLPFMSQKNLPNKFAILRAGPNGTHGYNTLEQAQADGAVTMAYGCVPCLSLAKHAQARG